MFNFKIKAGAFALGAITMMAMASPAHAVAFVGLYNTGVDNNGIVLTPGSVEQHYVITNSSNPALALPNTPKVATSTSWSANSPVGSLGSSWISPFTNANGVATKSTNLPTAVTYDYNLTFNLNTLSLASAVITGRVQSDNFVTILLNGVALPNQAQAPVPSPGAVSYFRQFSAFQTGGANFVNGANTLTFKVTDFGVISGLRVSDLVGVVPEPGTWAMLIVGFGLVAGQIRRRKRAGTYAIA
jgi:hypothetical protein